MAITVNTALNMPTVETPEVRPNQGWRQSIARWLTLSDTVVVALVVFITQYFWLGFQPEFGEVPYWVISLLIVLAWSWALGLNDSRSYRILGMGGTEYVRVISASLRLFGVIAIIAYLAKADIARGLLLLSLPIGIIALVLTRFFWRQWLIHRRAKGQYAARVVLVGTSRSVRRLAAELRRSPKSGLTVVGACLPPGQSLPSSAGFPLLGDTDDVIGVLRDTDADTIAIASTDELPIEKVKQISWSLEAGQQHLILAPSIIDIAGPRMHIRPVSGLPLIHVETPKFSNGQRLGKRLFDIVGATVALVLLSPVFVAVMIAVKASSRGPLLFRQVRIGHHGREFRMLKFRSMRVGADDELAELLARQGTADRPLFKVKNDPRITPVGRFLRRYSLDELPQLFNVIGGSMSLVGPRPQVAGEVALYDDAARRRLLTRPGVTGLWQVSGRSALDWEDAIRLDLSYVENWSFTGDLVILAKTAQAVLAPGVSAH
ncbi:sugar transferase [Microbacterium keratanolyticum]